MRKLLRPIKELMERIEWHFTNLTGRSRLSNQLRRIFPVLEGHSGFAVVPFFLLIPFLVAGPSFEVTDGVDWLLASVGILVFAFLLWLAGLQSRPLRIFSSPLGAELIFAFLVFAVFLALHVITVQFKWPYWSEANQSRWQPIHPNLLAAFVFGLLLIAWGIPRLLLKCFRLIPADIRVDPINDKQPLNEMLADADLLNKPDWPDPDKRFWRLLIPGMLSVPVYLPTQLLFGPAVFALLMILFRFPHIFFLTFVFLVGWWLILGIMRMLGFIKDGKSGFVGRMMYQGGPLVMSWIVIIIVLAYLRDIQYVSTVLDADWWLAMKYVLAGYLAVWVFEYWTNRKLSEAVLELIRPSDGAALREVAPEGPTGAPPQEATVPYFDIPQPSLGKASPELSPAGSAIEKEEQDLAATDVRVQVHTDTSITEIDPNHPEEAKSRVIHEEMKLSATLSGRTEPAPTPNVRVQIHAGAMFAAYDLDHPDDPKRSAVYEKIGLIETVIRRNGAKEADYNLPDLRNSITYYSGVLDFVLVAVLVFAGIWMYKRDRPAVVEADNVSGRSSLNTQLFHREKDRVILLAGSGGGTRAALYTASVLEGLHKIGVLDEVVLTSGVSGGGASLAYFAANKDELVCAKTDSDAWDRFHTNMSDAFMSHVLEGASEFRIATGTPLGQLLAEDFKRAFKDGGAASPNLGKVSHVAIWNTTLCGEYPPRGATGGKTERIDEEYIAPGNVPAAQLASKYHAGGRLVFTNMNTGDRAFRRDGFEDSPRDNLRYVVVGDPKIKLWDIAALNANFPPVFQNASVDLMEGKAVKEEYWVTDGGAMENRGLISLLYALRDTLEHARGKTLPRIPEIHIVVAEASAGGIDYTHDQGLGAASGAKAMVANGLIEMLVSEVAALEEELHEEHGTNTKYDLSQRIHYLTMPSVFRMRGGMGTHWIMHESVNFVNTNSPNKDEAEKPSEAEKIGVNVGEDKDSEYLESFALDDHMVRQVIRNLHPEKMLDYVWSKNTKSFEEFTRTLKTDKVRFLNSTKQELNDKTDTVSFLNRTKQELDDKQERYVKRLRRWIENDYQGTHKESWARLLEAFAAPATDSKPAKEDEN